MKITLLTCTGGRQDAFDLCFRWMYDQTVLNYKNELLSEWVIVDDGPEATEVNRAIPKFFLPKEIIRPEKLWEPGQNTQVSNLRIGLDAIFNYQGTQSDIIFFIEDDDHYLPHYLETAIKAFVADSSLLVWGERPTAYYNVRHRQFRRLENQSYSILAATAIRRQAIPIFLSSLDHMNKGSLDYNFWYRVANGELRHRCRLERAGYKGYKSGVVGIKGMPGRPGIGKKFHNADKSKYWRKDPDMRILTRLIGPSAEHYARFYEQRAN